MLDQEKICFDIPKIPRGLFIRDIKTHTKKIFLSDLNIGVELLYEFYPNEIHGVISSDVADK